MCLVIVISSSASDMGNGSAAHSRLVSHPFEACILLSNERPLLQMLQIVNNTADSALTITQNDTYGIIGVTYKASADNIGRSTILTAGQIPHKST